VLGELITDRGIGNGMSAADLHLDRLGLPSSLWAIKETSKLGGGWVVFLAVDRDGHDHGRLLVFIEAGPAAHPGAVRQEAGRSADYAAPRPTSRSR